ncbi:hypothetical protein ES288_A01G092400v1 [Gossypium darwinii]|uniref:Uncharacterized protein n=1 Tax=Gossypium darwinii TaxID=34276 RepID=A0A5D2HJD2_GOSDA|nr:hypothetical protein ES288_A01G092400v1 [Gossypium darwinii]
MLTLGRVWVNELYNGIRFYIGPPLGLRPQPSPVFLLFIHKKPFLNPCSFPLDRRHSLFAPSPDFCFAGVAIVSNYNRFHQQVHLYFRDDNFSVFFLSRYFRQPA